MVISTFIKMGFAELGRTLNRGNRRVQKNLNDRYFRKSAASSGNNGKSARYAMEEEISSGTEVRRRFSWVLLKYAVLLVAGMTLLFLLMEVYLW